MEERKKKFYNLKYKFGFFLFYSRLLFLEFHLKKKLKQEKCLYSCASPLETLSSQCKYCIHKPYTSQSSKIMTRKKHILHSFFLLPSMPLACETFSFAPNWTFSFFNVLHSKHPKPKIINVSSRLVFLLSHWIHFTVPRFRSFFLQFSLDSFIVSSIIYRMYTVTYTNRTHIFQRFLTVFFYRFPDSVPFLVFTYTQVDVYVRSRVDHVAGNKVIFTITACSDDNLLQCAVHFYYIKHWKHIYWLVLTLK